MGYDLKALKNGHVLYLSVWEVPPEEEALALNRRMADEINRNGINHLIVDYRDMVKADMSAGLVRTILTQMDRMLEKIGRVPPALLKVALISREGSFGHGIARMTVGHSYGLRLLTVRQFVDVSEVWIWFRLARCANAETLAGPAVR